MPNVRNRHKRHDESITVLVKDSMPEKSRGLRHSVARIVESASKRRKVMMRNATQGQIMNAVDAALRNQTEILKENLLLKERVQKLEERYNKLEKNTIANGRPEVETLVSVDAELDTEWEYYESNRDELVKNHCGKYVVISGNRVLDVYEDENVAYFDTIEKGVPLGTFIIQHIMEEEEVLQLSPYVSI